MTSSRLVLLIVAGVLQSARTLAAQIADSGTGYPSLSAGIALLF